MTKQQFLQLFNASKEDTLTLTGDEALEAVKQNGYALQHVRDQTPEICLEAVKKHGYALQYVKDQTPEICLEAVKQDGDALKYVNLDVFEDDTTVTVTLELTPEQLNKIKDILNK